MCKRLTAFFLLVSLLFCTVVAQGDEPKELTNTDGYVYIVNDDNTAEIVGYTGKGKDLEIPSAIDGHTVTAIGLRAFAWNKITTVKIPGTVNTLKTQCFDGCRNLKSVEMSEGVRTIQNDSFYRCEKLQTINVPDSVTGFGEGVLGECWSLKEIQISENHSLLALVDGVLFTRDMTTLLWRPSTLKEKEYHVPEGVRIVGSSAITSKTLEKIVFPDSVEEIGWGNMSKKLKEVNIPPLVKEIDLSSMGPLETVFVDEGNPVFESKDGVVFDKEKHMLVYYPQGRKAKEYVVPEGTEIIGRDAFASNNSLMKVELPSSVRIIDGLAFQFVKKLNSIILPEGLEKIDGIAFQGCENLTEINIPNSLTTIADNPFYLCSKLKTINVPEDHSRFAIMDEALVDKQGMHLICFPSMSKQKTYRVPDGIKIIDKCAFGYCSSLQEIIIPEGVEKLDEMAFVGCSKIKRFVLPASLKEIDKNALLDSTNATFVVVRGSYAENFCQAYGLKIEYAE